MKYFLLQTSCEYKSLSSPELPQYPLYCQIPQYTEVFAYVLTTAAQPSRGQDDSNMSQMLHPWFIGATRGFCAVWYASESQRSRRPIGNSWLCGFVLHTLTEGERVHVTLAMHVCSMDTDRNETAGNQCVWSMWYCYCPLGHGHSPALSSYPWKRHQASVLLVTDSKTKSNRRDLVRFEFYSFSETCSYIRTCFYLKWLIKEEQNQFVTEPTIFVICIARCIWQLD